MVGLEKMSKVSALLYIYWGILNRDIYSSYIQTQIALILSLVTSCMDKI